MLKIEGGTQARNGPICPRGQILIAALIERFTSGLGVGKYLYISFLVLHEGVVGSGKLIFLAEDPQLYTRIVL